MREDGEEGGNKQRTSKSRVCVGMIKRGVEEESASPCTGYKLKV